MKKRTLVFIVVSILLISTITSASAQELEETPACVGDQVTGTVVAVDEEAGLVTIDYGDGECTVSLTTDYGHPIVSLLVAYFSEVDMQGITAALEETQVCVVYDETTDTWSVVELAEGEECPEGGETVTVTSEEDGIFTATKGEGDETEEITFTLEDETAADALSAALGALEVEWDLDEDGSLADVGDDIAAYHEDGIGFGVLVKLYAIVAESPECAAETPTEEDVLLEPLLPEEDEPPCDVTIEELMALLDEGMGLGEIFEVYGKPSLLGVGHVRADSDGDGGGGDDCAGVLHARSVGGKAKATGKDCGDGGGEEPADE
jgi:hypothetical protein